MRFICVYITVVVHNQNERNCCPVTDESLFSGISRTGAQNLSKSE